MKKYSVLFLSTFFLVASIGASSQVVPKEQTKQLLNKAHFPKLLPNAITQKPGSTATIATFEKPAQTAASAVKTEPQAEIETSSAASSSVASVSQVSSATQKRLARKEKPQAEDTRQEVVLNEAALNSIYLLGNMRRGALGNGVAGLEYLATLDAKKTENQCNRT